MAGMSKSASIDALMESAIRHFALYGFEGSSLRDIAQEAGAPLSTIDRYFGSKASLFRSVLQKVWSEVERDREHLLKKAMSGRGRRSPDLTDLIDVLARPIVRRALSQERGDLARTLLLRSGRPERVAVSVVCRPPPPAARRPHKRPASAGLVDAGTVSRRRYRLEPTSTIARMTGISS